MSDIALFKKIYIIVNEFYLPESLPEIPTE